MGFPSPLALTVLTKTRLTEEISDDLHALRSAEEPSHANHFSQKSAPNLQIVPGNANTEGVGRAWFKHARTRFVVA
jgi:hypothetical protein